MAPDRALYPHSTDGIYPAIGEMCTQCNAAAPSRNIILITELIAAQRSVLDAIATGSSLQSTHTTD